MKKLAMKTMSVLLTLVMLLGMIPVISLTASAAGADTAEVGAAAQLAETGAETEVIVNEWDSETSTNYFNKNLNSHLGTHNGFKIERTSNTDNHYKLTLTANIATNLITFSDPYIWTIDLNGYGIRYKDIDRTALGRFSNVIYSQSTLTIIDSNPFRATRYIQLDSSGRGIGVSGTKPAGEEWTDYIKVTGGYITGSPSGSSGGISALYSSYIYGGTICGNTSTAGGGVYTPAGTVYMYNATICGNTTSNTGGGGGIFCRGTLYMYGGVIKQNKANSANTAIYAGGGLFSPVPYFATDYVKVGSAPDGSNAVSTPKATVQSAIKNHNDGYGYIELGNGIDCGDSENGTVVPEVPGDKINLNVESGQTVTLNVAPDEGNVLQSLTVTNETDGTEVDLTQVDETKYTFTMPTGRVKVNPVFGPAIQYYDVTWKNDDGTTLAVDPVEENTVPVYGGATPEKAGADDYAYIFTGWSDGTTAYAAGDALPAVTGDATYTATYLKVSKTLFAGYSLSLKGDIGLNFYIDPTYLDLNDATVTVNGDQTHTFDQATPVQIGDRTLYMFSAPVCAAEINDRVNVTVNVGGSALESHSYSVADYARRIIANADGEFNSFTALDKLQTLCEQMLIYGAKAQIQFNHNTDAMADEGMEYTLADVTVSKLKETQKQNLSAFGLEYYGSSLLLNSTTTNRIYCKVTDEAKLAETTCAYGTRELEIKPVTDKSKLGNPDGEYVYIDLGDIYAKRITDYFTLTFTKGGTKVNMNVNAGGYIKGALDSGDDTLKTTVTALYWYNQAAIAYFNAK